MHECCKHNQDYLSQWMGGPGRSGKEWAIADNTGSQLLHALAHNSDNNTFKSATIELASADKRVYRCTRMEVPNVQKIADIAVFP